MKTMDEVVALLDIPLESALGQFNRAVRRLLKTMTSIQEKSLAQHLPAPVVPEFVPVDISLDQDLNQAAEVKLWLLWLLFDLSSFLWLFFSMFRVDKRFLKS